MNRVKQAINTTVLVLFWVSPFASTVRIAFMWRYVSLTEVEVQHRWRKALLRVAQVVVTVAAALTRH